jgi:hypothetical protein
MPDRKKIRAKEIIKDIRIGMDDKALMAKYELSPKGLKTIFKRLVDAGVITESELYERLSANLATSSATQVRSTTRCYPVVRLSVYDLDDLGCDKYHVVDISETGIQISGIAGKIGEMKSFLIQADEFGDVFPFQFDAECKWLVPKSDSALALAGFEFRDISSGSLHELRKIIKLMTFS